MNSAATILALSALAQPHRLAVFRLLVQAGPEGRAAGALAASLDLPASSLSFHLAHLSRAGLITASRVGRSLIYAADFARMRAVIDFLTDNCCGGTACAAADAAPRRRKA